MINYFQRMIPDLTYREIPLIGLLRKEVRLEWDERREKAFLDLKETFMHNLRIYHPNYQEPFILRTYASIQRFSGVLLQKQGKNKYPIYFVSRTTKKHEQNYSVLELELARIIFCITKLRFYLLGNEIIIETYHLSLTTIKKN